MDPVMIVGGGLAGLCCGRRLFQCGVPFRILEASDAVGGRVRTDVVDGFRLDRGFQIYLTAYPEGRRVLDYDALDLQPFTRGAMVWLGRGFHRVADPRTAPLSAVGSVFNSVGTVVDKFRVAKLAGRLMRGGPEDHTTGDDRPTVDFLRWNGRFSDRMIDRLFRPFFGGVFLDKSLVTSDRLFRYLMRMFIDGPGAVPAAGMQAIPDQIAAGLPAGSVTLNCPVEAIDETSVRLTTGETVSAKAVVVATDGTTAHRLTNGVIPDLAWRGSTTLYYAAEPPPTDEPILHLDGTGLGPVNSAVVLSAAAPGYAPPGQSLVSASVVGVPAESDYQLDRAARKQIGGWFGSAVERWRLLRIDRIRTALPAQPAGELDPWERPICPRPGVYVCGDHRDQASINGAMVSGFRAAQTVMADFAAAGR